MPALSNLRHWSYVIPGALAGVVYVVFDIFSEAKLAEGTLTGVLAPAHAIVDHSFPILAGGLLGLCSYQLRLHKRLHVAEQAAERAEILRMRLQKVERDQAVWVVAAAILHALNNPLHALGLLLDEQSHPDIDRDRQLELNERARVQVSRALDHLATLRSMHTLGEPALKCVALDQLASSLAGELDLIGPSDRVSVRVDCPGPVNAKADPLFVRTILENLLDNSLQALRETSGGSIIIQLAFEGGLAVVRVVDDGAPLSPDAQATLFDPLHTTKAHGLGLGLPVARALARAMRGDLYLETVEPKRFRLELPSA